MAVGVAVMEPFRTLELVLSFNVTRPVDGASPPWEAIADVVALSRSQSRKRGEKETAVFKALGACKGSANRT